MLAMRLVGKQIQQRQAGGLLSSYRITMSGMVPGRMPKQICRWEKSKCDHQFRTETSVGGEPYGLPALAGGVVLLDGGIHAMQED